MGAIWGSDRPNTAAAMIRTFAWRWRQMLERGSGAGSAVLSSVGDGYRISMPWGSLDLQVAERLATDAVYARDTGRLDTAESLLTSALGLWRGLPLPSVPGPFAAHQRARLEELRLTLTEERLELACRLGKQVLVVPELTLLAAEHQSRERLQELLGEALQAAGRTHDTPAAPRRTARLLPRQAGSGDPGKQGDRWTREERLPVPRQLPANITDFVGRDLSLSATLNALSRPVRKAPAIVAVTGTVGIGKTALALHVAHQLRSSFPDGQLYADLRNVGVQAEIPAILEGFLRTLGMRPAAIPAAASDRAGAFRSLTDAQRVLVVLDNVHEVSQIEPLLPGAATCGALITSRAAPYGVPVTGQVRLDVFSTAEAVSLLGKIIGPERLAAEEAQAVALVEACRLLPLAVRLAGLRLAARPRWTIGALADRLSGGPDGLAELRVGPMSLFDALAQVCKRLTPTQADVFRLLARHGTRIDLGTAAVLLGVSEPEAEHMLESLVDATVLETPCPGVYRYPHLFGPFARHCMPPGAARTLG
ncbi:BTAD domain-containing putative transcriptional regulator [Streptomyces sp. NPDC091279]|uniref:AfsR/SARP family transcriptional regulator n=1 Tax=unclassified Streptomyces TaxID=2593676 RepID=UPI003814904A